MPVQGQPPAHPTYDIDKAIQDALAEDAGGIGDITSLSTIPKHMKADAYFLAKSDGVVAGIQVATKVFHQVDGSIAVDWFAKDGDEVTYGTRLGQVHGPARSILLAERIALNFMQRMSGIATATWRMVERVSEFPARILDTRKTVPGLRLLDKWAVLIGGGCNHRMGLYDMIMIKDNHIAACGGISDAVRCAHKYIADNGFQDMQIEVETRTMSELQNIMELIEGWGTDCLVTRVMLDNMARIDEEGLNISLLKQAVEYVNGRVETEASGNVTIDTVHEIASTGVDFISCGALTHSVKAMDISLKIETRLD